MFLPRRPVRSSSFRAGPAVPAAHLSSLSGPCPVHPRPGIPVMPRKVVADRHEGQPRSPECMRPRRNPLRRLEGPDGEVDLLAGDGGIGVGERRTAISAPSPDASRPRRALRRRPRPGDIRRRKPNPERHRRARCAAAVRAVAVGRPHGLAFRRKPDRATGAASRMRGAGGRLVSHASPSASKPSPPRPPPPARSAGTPSSRVASAGRSGSAARSPSPWRT